MRYVPSELKKRLMSAQQTLYNNADPRAVLWISRPGTALKSNKFLEKQTVLTGTAITDVAVAACHPYIGRGNTKVYIGYVDNGIAHVKYALDTIVMANHLWVETEFSEAASAIALEFNGTMPKNRNGSVEFVTEQLPWVFWINAGVLYGCVLGDEANATTLASANASDVFAVRGMWSEVGGFDFGLIVFFIVSGQLYYRQLINGVWMDAVVVSACGGLDLTALTITSIAAMRTWDYRIVVQIRDSTGAMHELFSQFMGIGKQNVEHIQIKDIAAQGTITEIKYYDTKEADEHISIAEVTASGKLKNAASPVPTAAANVQNTAGAWNTDVQITLDHPVTPSTVAENFAAFALTQGSSSFACSAAVCSADGLTLTLTFAAFGSGEATVTYTPGTVSSEDYCDMAAWTQTFTPQNLVAPDGYAFEHISIVATAAGTLTAITYRNVQNGGEHLGISSATVTAALIHVNDL